MEERRRIDALLAEAEFQMRSSQNVLFTQSHQRHPVQRWRFHGACCTWYRWQG